jgi:uncharacterized membrane protein
MSWILRYRCRAFLRSSMCAVPIACALAAFVVAPLIRRVDVRTQWTLLGFGPEGARAVTGAVVASLLTFVVFSFSIILLAVQIASGQLSPRIIAPILESRLTKWTLGAFLFSFTYALTDLGRIEDRVPQLPLAVAGVSSLVSVVLFLYLIQQTGWSLKPGVILARVAAVTDSVIRAVYPNPFVASMAEDAEQDFTSMAAQHTIVHTGPPGIVLAFDAVGLVAFASGAGCTIEMIPRIGDFLALGAPVFRLHGSGAALVNLVNDDRLRRCVAAGQEQTLAENPVFGFQVLVEIGIKAIPPASNDPGTGVLAIDQIHFLLRSLGQRKLDTGVLRDSSGQVRLVYRALCWEEFITLSVTEIRLYGATTPQVTRRLQAMFEDLMQVLPAERTAPLNKEMTLLGRAIDRNFADPEDRILARVCDLQGLGSRQPDRNFAREKI